MGKYDMYKKTQPVLWAKGTYLLRQASAAFQPGADRMEEVRRQNPVFCADVAVAKPKKRKCASTKNSEGKNYAGRYVPVTCEGADACESFVDALLVLPRALDRTCSRVRYACKYADLRAPPDMVQCIAVRIRALRETLEDVEEYCLEKGCNVVTRNRTHIDATVFRQFFRHAVPLLLQCVVHMCVLHEMLFECARACRATAGMCSVSAGQGTLYSYIQHAEYTQRILGGLRHAREAAAASKHIADAAAQALGSHELALSVKLVARVIGTAARTLR